MSGFQQCVVSLFEGFFSHEIAARRLYAVPLTLVCAVPHHGLAQPEGHLGGVLPEPLLLVVLMLLIGFTWH